MHISILTSSGFCESGEQFPVQHINADTVLEEVLILAPGEQNPQGDEVLITGLEYVIGDKGYDLASGYALRAVVCDGLIVPKLRRATMSERYAFMKVVQVNPREQPRYKGEINEFWPVIEKIW